MKLVWNIWWISLIVKLALATILPLSGDEAYYWVWGQRLQLSYFDHPPLVAWLNALGESISLFGHMVRWPAVILGHCLLLFWIDILKNRIAPSQIVLLLVLFLLSPLLGFGSLIVTPDLPVMFFWSASIWSALRTLEFHRIKDYALLGVFLGLGFLSKYHIVLFVPCLVAYLTIEKKWHSVNWKGVLVTTILGLLCCSPVLIWNYQNEFQSFLFQYNHGFTRPSYKPSWTLSYLLGQILILFPTVILYSLRAKLQGPMRLLLYCGWVPLIFFFLTSFRALVEANWPIVAYPAMIALAVLGGITKFHVKIYTLFWGLITLVVLSTLFISPLRNLNDKIAEPYLYSELARETADYRPLYGNSYQLSSSLWYFSHNPVFKLSGISRYDFFDTFPEAKPQGSEFYLVKKVNQIVPAWVESEGFTFTKIKVLKDGFELLHFSR